jgi:pre-rRNA-processing protein TSR3
VHAAHDDDHRHLRFRSVPPGVRTAYPRRSKLYQDPAGGLASVEALAAALHVLGLPPDAVLDGYRWREPFLELNRSFFACDA